MLERGLSSFVPANIVLVNSTTEAERYLFEESELTGERKPSPDLVMLDVKVPPCGGMDLLKKVRADARTSSIPVVMLSGQMREEEVRHFYQSGANSYLDKPDDFHDFIAM